MMYDTPTGTRIPLIPGTIYLSTSKQEVSLPKTILFKFTNPSFGQLTYMGRPIGQQRNILVCELLGDDNDGPEAIGSDNFTFAPEILSAKRLLTPVRPILLPLYVTLPHLYPPYYRALTGQ